MATPIHVELNEDTPIYLYLHSQVKKPLRIINKLKAEDTAKLHNTLIFHCSDPAHFSSTQRDLPSFKEETDKISYLVSSKGHPDICCSQATVYTLEPPSADTHSREATPMHQSVNSRHSRMDCSPLDTSPISPQKANIISPQRRTKRHQRQLSKAIQPEQTRGISSEPPSICPSQCKFSHSKDHPARGEGLYPRTSISPSIQVASAPEKSKEPQEGVSRRTKKFPLSRSQSRIVPDQEEDGTEGSAQEGKSCTSNSSVGGRRSSAPNSSLRNGSKQARLKSILVTPKKEDSSPTLEDSRRIYDMSPDDAYFLEMAGKAWHELPCSTGHLKNHHDMEKEAEEEEEEEVSDVSVSTAQQPNNTLLHSKIENQSRRLELIMMEEQAKLNQIVYQIKNQLSEIHVLQKGLDESIIKQEELQRQIHKFCKKLRKTQLSTDKLNAMILRGDQLKKANEATKITYAMVKSSSEKLLQDSTRLKMLDLQLLAKEKDVYATLSDKNKLEKQMEQQLKSFASKLSDFARTNINFREYVRLLNVDGTTLVPVGLTPCNLVTTSSNMV